MPGCIDISACIHNEMLAPQGLPFLPILTQINPYRRNGT